VRLPLPENPLDLSVVCVWSNGRAYCAPWAAIWGAVSARWIAMALKAVDQKSESFAKDVLSEVAWWGIFRGRSSICAWISRHSLSQSTALQASSRRRGQSKTHAFRRVFASPPCTARLVEDTRHTLSAVCSPVLLARRLSGGLVFWPQLTDYLH
jgi:hypothetical protein